MKFYKYQGTGNDFVVVDDRSQTFPISQELIAHLCHRRFGIGADGLMLLQEAEGYDFRMVYFNADGTEGSMCGNGGRCLVRFAHDLGIIGNSTTFIAVDGEHEAKVTKEVISLKMIDVNQIDKTPEYDFMNTGSPHYVTYVSDLTNYDVFNTGKTIRYGEPFVSKGGTNVNFVEVTGENALSVRTYERGVEDETYACGTGVTACALSANIRLGFENFVDIKVIGGQLRIEFERTENGYQNIFLIGPAIRAFEGEVDLTV
ncbi:diaminopimelate epimerase [Arcicella aquatica]|uniref:Diaminopimelate epimerase n=1 Tax=Arcicella aquatica TaxID=217141 RepID=A0ABU5QH52_9BACT|nr:diaminopimelate epimerase [Arcicella aquatica]MEA5256366.1 diaminopimelate epimerase [Arcicella aquatica]